MITKKKALGITRQLFIWLSENPNKGKRDWPGWDKYGAMHSHCACCQYIFEHDLECEACPIEWGSERMANACYSATGSPYGVWYNSEEYYDRSKYALEVVALAVAAEKALKGG